MGLATMIVDTIWEYLQYKLYRNNGGSAEHLLGRSSILHASAKQSTMGIRFFFRESKSFFFSRREIIYVDHAIPSADVKRRTDSSSACVVAGT